MSLHHVCLLRSHSCQISCEPRLAIEVHLGIKVTTMADDGVGSDPEEVPSELVDLELFDSVFGDSMFGAPVAGHARRTRRSHKARLRWQAGGAR